MSRLNLGLEVRDFDLERTGFSLSVLDEAKKRQQTEAYLRMTLLELRVFVDALRAAREDIDISTYELSRTKTLPPATLLETSGSRVSEKAGTAYPGRRKAGWPALRG